jgi:hypothetical protein
VKENPYFTIELAVRIIGPGNQIIHGYYSISGENIWGIAMVHLPKLKSEADLLINKQLHLTAGISKNQSLGMGLNVLSF